MYNLMDQKVVSFWFFFVPPSAEQYILLIFVKLLSLTLSKRCFKQFVKLYSNIILTLN